MNKCVWSYGVMMTGEIRNTWSKCHPKSTFSTTNPMRNG